MGANAQKIPADKVWNQADTDGSGSLTRPEVTALIQKLWATYKMEKPLSNAFINGVLGELDVNGDNQITRKEFDSLYDELWDERATLFASYLNASKPGDAKAYEATLKSIFDRCDGDKSGNLSLVELQQLILKDSEVSKFFHIPNNDPAKQKALMARLFAEVDDNNDQRLTWPEFQAWAKTQQEQASGTVQQQAGPKPGAGVATAKAGTHPDWIKCPHCAYEIDPKGLEKLRVPPEAVAMQAGNWDTKPKGSSATGLTDAAVQQALPPGYQVRGHVPLSFLRGPHNVFPSGSSGS